MEDNLFGGIASSSGGGGNNLPSQALVVLSEAASGLHEALTRSQRPFQTRITDLKELHNMPLGGNYGSQLLHNFNPHLLQTLNQNMLGSDGSNGFFTTSRSPIPKPVLSNFQVPSAFSPPKYMAMSLDQNVFNGTEPFRTDSTSPLSVSSLTKNDSLEGPHDYDTDKDESPRNMVDGRDRNRIQANKQTPPIRSAGSMYNCCPVCGIRLTLDEWNTHFLIELDRLYKLSTGINNCSNYQPSFLWGPCGTAEMRSGHNRWETFQRIRGNRQNRLKIKVRKRKYASSLYFLENLFCQSCPICKRKFSAEGVSKNENDESHVKDEAETVDVENYSDDTPDSGSDVLSANHSNSNKKTESVLYKSMCLINKSDMSEENWETMSNLNNSVEDEITTCTTAQPGYTSVDSCIDRSYKDANSNNESDEDVIVDDDTVKVYSRASFDDESSVSQSNSIEEGCPTESQVTSTASDQTEISNRYNIAQKENSSINSTTTASLMCNSKLNSPSPSSSSSSTSTSHGGSNIKATATTTCTTILSSDQHHQHHHHNLQQHNNHSSNHQHQQHTVLINNNHHHNHHHHHHQQQQQQLETENLNNGKLSKDENYKCFICKKGLENQDSFLRGRTLFFHQNCVNVMSNYRPQRNNNL